jgi:hypothetical protein
MYSNVFSYTQALDYKTPLLRALQVIGAAQMFVNILIKM